MRHGLNMFVMAIIVSIVVMFVIQELVPEFIDILGNFFVVFGFVGIVALLVFGRNVSGGK